MQMKRNAHQKVHLRSTIRVEKISISLLIVLGIFAIDAAHFFR